MGAVPVTVLMPTTSFTDRWNERRAPERVSVSVWGREDRPYRLPSWTTPVVDALNRLLRRRDSEDVVPTSAAVRSAIETLARVMEIDSVVPSVVPSFGGGLQLEWHCRGVDLEVYVEADGSVSAWCQHASGREWEDDGEPDLTRLKKELSLLTHHDD
jgi:hypothetical protein